MRGRVFGRRFRTSNHARNASRTLRSKFRKIEIRDFEILVIFGIRDFEESEVTRIEKFLVIPVLCRDNVMQVRKRGASEPRGSRFRMTNHARVAPRTLRSEFGKIENF